MVEKPFNLNANLQRLLDGAAEPESNFSLRRTAVDEHKFRPT